jgi:excisionase family DNA binding protein
MNDLPETMTRAEAASYLRVSLPTINKLMRLDKLQFVKVGALTRILTASVRAMMTVKS